MLHDSISWCRKYLATRRKGAFEDEYWKRWFGDPHVGALSIAVFCCLRGHASCQQAAETWYRLCANLLNPRFGARVIRRNPALRNWARFLCREWELDHLSRTDRGLCIAIADVMQASVCRVIYEGPRADVPLDGTELLRLMRQWIPQEALDALSKAAGLHAQPLLGFHVVPKLPEQVASIRVSPFREVESSEQMRVRPHRFRTETADSGIVGPEDFRVAQLAEEIGADGTVGESHCDTIQEDNPMLPFWPSAAMDPRDAFSHRCAVRHVNSGLEWSDWPQVSASLSDRSLLPWRFVTGVFSRSEREGVFQYELLARAVWTIDWARA